MSIIGWIIVGLIAGWIAEKLTKSEHGLLTNLVIGVIGAMLGGWLAGLVGLEIGEGWIASILVASVGAVIFLSIWRAIRGSS